MAEAEVEYPEHEKLKAIQPQTQAIGEFLTWLGELGYEIGQWVDDDEFVPSLRGIHDWLAEYADIDQAKLESEKRLMLELARLGAV